MSPDQELLIEVERQQAHRVSVVWKHEARAAAKLDDGPRELGYQLATLARQARLVSALHQRVV
jgi:hypothetical protein